MDISSIANLAVGLAQSRNAQEVSLAVFKKALDTESAGALALIAALPPTLPANLPPHLGQNINTVA